jgi:hypothetical protein
MSLAEIIDPSLTSGGQTRCWKCRRKTSTFYGWRICSDGPLRWICKSCDLALNKMALKWAYPKTWKRRFVAYEASIDR